MRQKFSFILTTIVATLFATGCGEEKKSEFTEVILTNTSNIELTEKAVSLQKIGFPEAAPEKYVLITSGNDTIPSQLSDIDGDGEWDEIFLLADFSANEEKKIQVHWVGEQPQYEQRTNVRFGKRESSDEPVEPATEETLSATDMPKSLGFQKYQTDGPTWENDKVAFRHYLDGRNAKDVFGKTSSGITPQDVGISDSGAVEDNYHTMAEWGRDIFPVGNSLGLGGFALMVDDEVKRLGVTVDDTLSNIEETNFKILTKGPLKSVLQYTYNNWKAGDSSYDAQETTSIWAGMYGYKNTVTLNGLQEGEMLLLGLSNINNENPLQEIEMGDFVALMLHDNQTYEREWVLGTALLIPKSQYDGYIEAPQEGQVANSYLAKINAEDGEAISYYAVAAGEMSPDSGFQNAENFKNYLQELASQLSAEVTVEVNPGKIE